MVVPGAPANTVSRGDDETYRVRVAAPARDGKANRELIRYLAEVLDVPKSALSLMRGEASRRKVVVVSSLDSAETARRLDAAASG